MKRKRSKRRHQGGRLPATADELLGIPAVRADAPVPPVAASAPGLLDELEEIETAEELPAAAPDVSQLGAAPAPAGLTARAGFAGLEELAELEGDESADDSDVEDVVQDEPPRPREKVGLLSELADFSATGARQVVHAQLQALLEPDATMDSLHNNVTAGLELSYAHRRGTILQQPEEAAMRCDAYYDSLRHCLMEALVASGLSWSDFTKRILKRFKHRCCSDGTFAYDIWCKDFEAAWAILVDEDFKSMLTSIGRDDSVRIP